MERDQKRVGKLEADRRPSKPATPVRLRPGASQERVGAWEPDRHAAGGARTTARKEQANEERERRHEGGEEKHRERRRETVIIGPRDLLDLDKGGWSHQRERRSGRVERRRTQKRRTTIGRSAPKGTGGSIPPSGNRHGPVAEGRTRPA